MPDPSHRQWDALVAGHPHGHLLQTSNWAALKARFGWEKQLVTSADGVDLAAGAQILYRWLPSKRVPGRLFSIGYVPKGPVVHWDDPAQVRFILGRMTANAREHRAVFLRIEPNLLDAEMPALEASLADAGFRAAERSIQPRRTMLVDITGSEEDTLKRMKPKTRYNIRLAARRGIVVRAGAECDLPVFSQLMRATGERHAFGVHSSAYYRAALDLFSPSGNVRLLVAEYEDRPLAALMVFALGKMAYYLYGASSNRERQRMPAYLLQWEAIRWARAIKCTHYDLWGVPDEDKETLEAGFSHRSDGLWGVYRFKRGFGGRAIRWAGAFDRVLIPPLYWLFRQAGN